MDNNEIMNYEEVEVMDEAVEVSEGAGMSTGVAMLIGSGLTLAGIAVVKLAKKGIAAIKAKKALRKPDKEILVDEEDLAEVVE